VKGTPSRQQLHTTQVKQRGWYALPIARRMRSRMGLEHLEQRSRVLWGERRRERQRETETESESERERERERERKSDTERERDII